MFVFQFASIKILLVNYCFYHSKIKFISSRHCVNILDLCINSFNQFSFKTFAMSITHSKRWTIKKVMVEWRIPCVHDFVFGRSAVGMSNGPILFSIARIARKNYISACLLALTTFLQVLACSDFNIKCSVANISLLAKKNCNCSHARQKNHHARLLTRAHQDHSIPLAVKKKNLHHHFLLVLLSKTLLRDKVQMCDRCLKAWQK